MADVFWEVDVVYISTYWHIQSTNTIECFVYISHDGSLSVCFLYDFDSFCQMLYVWLHNERDSFGQLFVL